MIDARKPNYSETLLQIGELKTLLVNLEKNIHLQLPQGVANSFQISKNKFLNWVEEAEFTLENFKKL